MAFGIEFCMTKSSKSSKQRGVSQHLSSRKSTNVDAFQSTNNNTNGMNSNRNSQHSLNHRDHHTTPTTTTTATTTTTTPNPNLTLGPHNNNNNNSNNNITNAKEQNNQNNLINSTNLTSIGHVTTNYHALVEDELTVFQGDICLIISTDYEQGKSWSYVLCLTQNNNGGYVPSEILSIEKPKYIAQYRKKIPRTDHSNNNHHASLNHLHSHNHHNHHHHPRQHGGHNLDQTITHRNHHHHHQPNYPHPNYHHHGQHHTSGVAPTVISNSAGLIGHRVSQGEVNKIAQCISDKTTCPSNGDSFRPYPPHVDGTQLAQIVPPSDHHHHHQPRLNIHHHANLLQGSSSGCQTFQKYPDAPPFPVVHHLGPASYYNLDGPPPAEPPYTTNDTFVRPPSSECIPFNRDNPGDCYVVMFNFVNREERDISVKPGDYVYVLNKDDINWYWIRREEDNLEGFVPSGFIVPNDKAESVLNKGNSTITMKSSNAIDCHTYNNINQVPDGESLQTDQQSLPGQQI